ncbi:hypothetical protein [Pseudactinotalea sp. Z1748]|uniref:hypothetical protein n=1 Tax=Pseudactinotalea sp. Z1748 TaxID=3413027 RepID=UPI003C7BD8BC
MDIQVLRAQGWLNATYGGRAGWVPLLEDGQTGWHTIYGLRRGLQVELGISPLSSAFGPATTTQFVAQIGQITSSTTAENILRLLSASLWCKGFQGTYEGAPVTFTSLASGVSDVRDALGIGGGTPYVDVKMMASLMSMDAYRIPFGSGGTHEIREVQQWLNATYSSRRDFALGATDGRFSRQVLTSMLFGLQYEFGMADGQANGNFGPGTRDGLRNQASVGIGSQDDASNFVRLFQGGVALQPVRGFVHRSIRQYD